MARSSRAASRALFSRAVEQGGYFTAKQAKEVGYGYPHLEYHLRVGNFGEGNRDAASFGVGMADVKTSCIPVSALIKSVIIVQSTAQALFLTLSHISPWRAFPVALFSTHGRLLAYRQERGPPQEGLGGLRTTVGRSPMVVQVFLITTTNSTV
ncbi:hypothetical protein [Singulisphaera sp. GP187]|uniref:hypothetical protein n=1 Tax=Singulisphaera sp. GP187 TaxID=1882752 RepID=UPI001160E762|nr:hypothetical protein [Singulisphaera sp. GP187]